jgi:hypothetical protein
MIVKPHAARPDWFTWRDPPLEWYKPLADDPLPGLIFGAVGGKIIVDFHYTHLPCMPDEVRTIAEGYPLPVPPPLPTELLRPYQLQVRNELGGFRGALLAMEMRTGKTPLACHLHDPALGPLVIAGPLAAREAWKEWVDRTFNWPLACLATQETESDWPDLPAYFCHYEILGYHTTFLQKQGIGTLVLDEVHLLQSKHSQRVQAIALLTPLAKKILGLSGTPVWNRPISLWQLLHLITPGAWGTRHEFGVRYAGGVPGSHGWTYSGISHDEELRARLGYMTARLTWKDVAPELPPTTRVLEPVSLTAKQYADLEAAAMKATLARGTSNEAQYKATLRRKAGLLKVKPAVERALSAAEDGHKVVLWVWHNELGDKVEQHLAELDLHDWGLFRLQSSDAVNRREEIVADFRACNRSAFLVASMGVGGVGLDLSCSDCAIFVELDWTPAVVYQAEMRTFHKDRPHSVTYFYTDDPTESKLIAALGAKNGYAATLGLGSDDIMKAVL